MKIETINTEEYQRLRTEFYYETGIYAIKDNESYMNWLEQKLVKNLSLGGVKNSFELGYKKGCKDTAKAAVDNFVKGIVK